MKLLLFTFVVCFTAALAAPADKQKRDILPGDPRYGTEHEHHHEHHQEHDNEVQILKAAGGYIGSYTVPDDTVPADPNSFQVPQSTYGPASLIPGKTLGTVGTTLFGSSEIDKTTSLLVPSTSYGIPDTTQILNGNLVNPIVDDKKFDIIKTTIEEKPKLAAHLQKTVIPEIQHHVQPAIIQHHGITATPAISLPQVKLAATHVPTETQGVIQHGVSAYTSPIKTNPNYVSYSSYSNIPVKTVDHHVQVKVPQPYQVPVTKHVSVPIPVPHAVEVPKPYYVRVPKPVQYTVNRPYPVEVPRAVPYPVPQYVKTSVPVPHPVAHPVPYPVVHEQHAVDLKANPLQTFFDNTHSTFQNVFPGLPTFSNPLDNFQNSFQSFDISSIPGISFIPGPIQSFLPGTIPASPTPDQYFNPSIDTITIDNPAVETGNKVIEKIPIVKPFLKPTITDIGKITTHVKQPTTACAGCLVTPVTKGTTVKETVQPIDPNNGGYVY